LSKGKGDIENVGRLSMREGHRGRGAKEVMSAILGISSGADLCLLFQITTDPWSADMERAGSTDSPEAWVQPSIGVP
jgi:hypothetical protein